MFYALNAESPLNAGGMVANRDLGWQRRGKHTPAVTVPLLSRDPANNVATMLEKEPRNV